MSKYTKCDNCGQNYLPSAKNNGGCPNCLMHADTIHNASVLILQNSLRGAKTKFFKDNLKKYLQKLEDGPIKKEINEGLRGTHFVPDLYEIKEEEKRIIIHEVEDESTINTDKLLKICDIYWFLDEYGIRFHLFVYDRYGYNQREIDLLQYSLILKKSSDE